MISFCDPSMILIELLPCSTNNYLISLQCCRASQWRHMADMASQITSDSTVCSTVCSGMYQRKHPMSALMADDQWFPSQRTSTRKTFPCDDVIGRLGSLGLECTMPKQTKIFWHCIVSIVRTYMVIGFTLQNISDFFPQSWYRYHWKYFVRKSSAKTDNDKAILRITIYAILSNVRKEN